jgi:hypothetical protein
MKKYIKNKRKSIYLIIKFKLNILFKFNYNRKLNPNNLLTCFPFSYSVTKPEPVLTRIFLI